MKKLMRPMQILLLLTVLFSPALVRASSIRVEHLKGPLGQGDTFALEIFLDTGDEYINAIEGAVQIPKGLTVKEVRYAGSIVPLWLERPAKTAQGVSFAGVIPGGYKASPEHESGKNGNLFSIILEADVPGSYAISFSPQTSVYIDDGLGTKGALSSVGSTVSVGVGLGGRDTSGYAKDILPPESFLPRVVSGEPYGSNGSMLIFDTQDKDTGVSRFEVAFSYNRFAKEDSLTWTEASSPFALADNSLKKYIFVRATDAAGNTKMVYVSPQKVSAVAFIRTWGIWLLVIAALLVACVIHFLRKMRRVR